jgi:hypothetical protein
MPANQGLVEAFPSPEQQNRGPAAPGLRVITGDGETEFVPEAMERRAELHVVADPAEIPYEAEEATTERDLPESDVAEVAEIVAYVDVKSGRTRRYAGTKAMEMTISNKDVSGLYKRGGGGGSYYWFLKEQAKRDHDDSCNCHFCRY